MILISVITPVYNREDCIERCIDSVLSQNISEVEHIIVDDGSRDGTAQIIEKYAGNPRLKYIQLDTNRGVNFARNRAAENASGEFLLMLDSDDYLLDGALDIMLQSIHDYPSYQHFLFVPSDFAERSQTHALLKHPVWEVTFLDWLSGVVHGDFIHLFRRELLLELPFPEDFRIYEKLNFLRLHKRTGKQLYLNKVVAVRERNREDSVTLEYNLDNAATMATHYRYMECLVQWYGDDYATHNVTSIIEDLKKTVLLGIALGKYEENKKLFSFMERERPMLLLRALNALHCGPVVYLLIKGKSKLNQLQRQFTKA